MKRFLIGTFYLATIFGSWWLGRQSFSFVGDDHAGLAKQAATETLYTCGMHPQVIQKGPGLCPICRMDLVPVGSNSPGSSSSDSHEDSQVVIEPEIEQNMGVRFARVEKGALSRNVRTVGYLAEAESRVHEVSLLVGGWVRRLHANATGMMIEKGAPLFEIYSPEIQVAITELIEARRAGVGTAALGGAMKTLYSNTFRKLERWGLSKNQVEELARRETVPESVAILAPIRGYVAEKNVVEGSAVEVGMKAFKLVDYSVLWVDAKVFSQDLPFAQSAEKANLSSLALPGHVFNGVVTKAVLPVDSQSRQATLRLEVQNSQLLLRPGMFVNVDFSLRSIESQVVIPNEAIIDTGLRKVVFVKKDAGKFAAREVTVGLTGEKGLVQVLSGLQVGEEIVLSGQFLLDSESRFQEAIRKFAEAGRSEYGQANKDHRQVNEREGREKDTISDAEQAAVDQLVRGYLAFSRELGEVQPAQMTFDTSSLLSLAGKLVEVAKEKSLREMAAEIEKSARILQTKEIAKEQREAFKQMSELMIKLVSKVAPSSTVGNSLYLFHCPMADAEWLQSEAKIANPFYSSSMKSCGDLLKELKFSNVDKPAAADD